MSLEEEDRCDPDRIEGRGSKTGKKILALALQKAAARPKRQMNRIPGIISAVRYRIWTLSGWNSPTSAGPKTIPRSPDHQHQKKPLTKKEVAEKLAPFTGESARICSK